MELLTRSIIGCCCTAVLAITQISCSNYVYAPAVLLSQKPLEKGAVDIKGGVGLLPKVKPNTDYSTTEAGILDVGYGITDKVSLYVNAWSDLSTKPFFYKAGVSFSSRVSVWQNATSEFVLYPRFALLKNGETFDALGFQLSALYITTLSDKCYSYLGIGGITGNRSISENNHYNDQLYGALGHIGLGYNATPYFRIMAEINPVYQYNNYYASGNFLLSPTLSIGYVIGMSPDDGTKYKNKQQRKR